MLVLSRRVGEKIRIGTSIVVTLLKVDRNKARIGVEAPADVPVVRQELFEFAKDRPAVASEGSRVFTTSSPRRDQPAQARPSLGFSAARCLWNGANA